MEYRKYTTTRTGDRTYQNSYVDGCRNCGGSGLIELVIPVGCTAVMCPVCEGSGSVSVTKKIEVIVKPYKTITR